MPSSWPAMRLTTPPLAQLPRDFSTFSPRSPPAQEKNLHPPKKPATVRKYTPIPTGAASIPGPSSDFSLDTVTPSDLLSRRVTRKRHPPCYNHDGQPGSESDSDLCERSQEIFNPLQPARMENYPTFTRCTTNQGLHARGSAVFARDRGAGVRPSRRRAPARRSPATACSPGVPTSDGTVFRLHSRSSASDAAAPPRARLVS